MGEELALPNFTFFFFAICCVVEEPQKSDFGANPLCSVFCSEKSLAMQKQIYYNCGISKPATHEL